MRGAKAEQRYRLLFERHWRRVLAYSYRRIGDELSAEDVAAEVFTVAWRRISEIPPEHELAWLIGVARRVLANFWRSQARRDRMIQRVGTETYIRERFLETEPGGLQELYGEALRTAMASLRPIDVEVLRLALWEDLTHLEIAMIFGCKPGTVAVRLHRSRERLRIELIKAISETGYKIMGESSDTVREAGL